MEKVNRELSSLGVGGGVGNELSSLLTAFIRSGTGPDKFTCVMSSHSHKNPGGKEVSFHKSEETQAGASVICSVSTATK